MYTEILIGVCATGVMTLIVTAIRGLVVKAEGVVLALTAIQHDFKHLSESVHTAIEKIGNHDNRLVKLESLMRAKHAQNSSLFDE